MSQRHEFYLSLGSNIEPEANLARAIERLQEHGSVEAMSGVWESQAVGSTGPNFLNLCLRFVAALEADPLKEQVLRPVEADLGRRRTDDKNARRTIDIDILVVDGKAVNVNRWIYAFVLVPLSELLPDFIHPLSHKPLSEAAGTAEGITEIVQRARVLEELRGKFRT